MRPAGSVALLAIMWTARLPDQNPVSPDTISIVLGPRYAHPPGVKLLHGDAWRALWTDTVRVPVLRRDSLGGKETIVRDANGLAWRLLPVDLNPAEFRLAPELRGGKVEDWLDELTVTMHPTAPLVASALYEAVGLHAVRPRLAATPDGRGVWIVRAAEEDGKPLDGLERVLTSDSLAALLRRDPTTLVDLRAFLRARLLDLVMGDRQSDRRHWLWGLERRNGPDIWVPIAARQQQAFLRAPLADRFLLGTYGAGFTTFDARRPATRVLEEAGYDFDRPLLARLERPVWDSIGTELRVALTRDVITRALAELPPPHWEASAATLASALEVRRDLLAEVVDDLYREVVSYADIELSDASESVRITRLSVEDLELTVETGGREVLHRVFRFGETRELRLHLRGGDDRVILEGDGRHKIAIRITGGAGHDVVERPGAGIHRVVVYDLRDGVTMNPDDAARLVPRQEDRFRLWPDSGSAPGHRDWGMARSPILAFDITGDLGLVARGGMQWIWYGFGQPHYRQRTRGAIEYASRPNGFRGYATFERRDVLRNIHLTASLRATGIDVVRFFGYGNETPYTQDLDYYLAKTKEIGVTVMAGFSRDPALEFRIGPTLRLAVTDTMATSTLVGTSQPYGSGPFNMAGLEAQFNYTPRRARYEQGLGLWARANGRFYPEVMDVTQGAFGGVDGEARLTWVPRPASRLMLAGRVGGSILRGTVPFSMAARVAGPGSLRGWETSRFTGNRGSAYAGLELRARLFRYRVGFVPGDLGFLAFGDGGRVWTTGESSNTIHWGGGGGIWMAPALGWIRGVDEMIGRLEIAWGERTIVSLGTGFRF